MLLITSFSSYLNYIKINKLENENNEGLLYTKKLECVNSDIKKLVMNNIIPYTSSWKFFYSNTMDSCLFIVDSSTGKQINDVWNSKEIYSTDKNYSIILDEIK